MKHNLDLNDLSLFVQVVDAGSFSEASRRLCIPKTTISRRITRLEKLLGVSLIQRNTHQFEATHLGLQYYQYCLELVQQAQRAQHFIEQYSELQGSIRISCPKEILDLYVNEMVTDFMMQYRDIEVFIESTNRAVDMIKERLDFAIRARIFPLKDSGLITKPLLSSRHYLVASPELVAKPLTHLNEVDHYPIASASNYNHYWLFEHQELGQRKFHYSPKLICENLYLIQQSVRKGICVATLPDAVIGDDLLSGKLHSISPQGWEIPKVMVHAAYSSRKSMQSTARLLLNFLSKRFAEYENQGKN